MLSMLRRDIQAQDAVHLSLISYDFEARQTVPLTPLSNLDFFPTLDLQMVGNPFLGNGIKSLVEHINLIEINEALPPDNSFMPLVFFLVLRHASDICDFREAVKLLKQTKTSMVVACVPDRRTSFNTDMFMEFADKVIQFDDYGPQLIADYFKWIASLITTICSKSDINVVDALPPLPTNMHYCSKEKIRTVRFIGINDEQVSWGGGDDPRRRLTVGETYTVYRTEISSDVTFIYLDRFKSRGFNSAAFEEVEPGSKLLQEVSTKC